MTIFSWPETLPLMGAQYGRGDWGPGMMNFWGYGWMNWIMMLIFWGLLIIGGFYLVRWLVRGGGAGTGAGQGSPGPGGNRALDILNERYARGELNREQYEQMKRDISAG